MIGRKDEATTDGGLSLSQCQTCDRSAFVSIKPGLVSRYQPSDWLLHSPCAGAHPRSVCSYARRSCAHPLLHIFAKASAFYHTQSQSKKRKRE